MHETEPKVQVKITTDTLPSLYANPGLMKPLFANLIGNAVKYRKKDVETHIQVRWDQQSQMSNGNSPRYFRNPG
jgi:light-regulated signal transduction histidine kinase (bacteriophytochrome)